jgi:beta-lactam-binding protein with PASTA domain
MVEGEEELQETVYGLMALGEFDRVDYLGEVSDAGIYLQTVQLVTGGWENYPGYLEYNEYTGEALRGIAAALGQPVVVPEVVDENEADANSAITVVGLVVGTITYEYNDIVEAGLVISQNPTAGTEVPIGSPVDLVVSGVLAPGVIDQNEADANSAITAAGLVVGTVSYQYSDTVDANLVISQSPIADTAVPIGSSVDLVISSGQPVVPDVVGMTEPNATAEITAVDNLTVGTVTYEYSDTITAGDVISQNPVGGNIVPTGSSIDLVVSGANVPDVVLMTKADANSTINAEGLIVGAVTYEYSDTVVAGLVISQSPSAGTAVSLGSPVDIAVSSGQPTVPYVVDMTEPNATAAIAAVDNLAVGAVIYDYSGTIAPGHVISQSPVGGTVVPTGSTVDLVLSLGPAIYVPDVVGEPQADANSAITGASLTVGTITYEYSNTVPTGHVISQNPVADTIVIAGTAVDIIVSSGRPVVPDVVGETAAAAVASIESVDNLTAAAAYASHNIVPVGRVISQIPVAGAEVDIGSTVNILVSLGRPTVPGVVGQSEAQAVATIEAVDNLVAVVTYEYSQTVETGTVISQNPSGGTVVDVGTIVNIFVSLGQLMVPNVVDMTEAEAITTIEAIDDLMTAPVYQYDNNVPFGTVVSQNPTGGTVVDIGTTVNIFVSLGRPEVPGVVNMTEPNATAAIIAVDNLAVGTVTYEYSNTVPTGRVIRQDPAGSTEVLIGSTVDFVVSLGRPVVPNVVDQNEAAAVSAIEAIDNLIADVVYEYHNTVEAGKVINQDPSGYVTVDVGTVVNIVVSLGQAVVPDVVGMTTAQANSAITSAGLTVGTITYMYSATVPAGLVISQSLPAGVTVSVGLPVDLVVSAVIVPNVINQLEADANSAITAAGLIVGVTYEYSNIIPDGNVMYQNPVGGTPVDVSTTVNIKVSLGKPTVPDVVNKTEPNATAAIVAVDNLTVGIVTYEYNDSIAYSLVISQDPNGGTEVPVGSTVDLMVSLGQPTVPDVVGDTEPNATAAIVAVDNLTIGTVSYLYSDTVDANLVISQNPTAGSSVPIGSSVDLMVSLGRPMVPGVAGQPEAAAVAAIEAVDNLVAAVTYEHHNTVPMGDVSSQDPVPGVVGWTEAAAVAAIEAIDNLVATVTTEYHDTVPEGYVIRQNPVGDTPVDVGTPVNIVISLGRPVVPDVVGETEPNATVAITAIDNLTVGIVTYEWNDTIPAWIRLNC